MEHISTEPGSSSSSGPDSSRSIDFIGPQTYELLKQVIQGIHNELNKLNDKNVNAVNVNTARLTGFHPVTILKVHRKMHDLSGKELERKAVHLTFKNFCIVHKRYPNCYEMLKKLSEYPQVVYDMQSLVRSLTGMGYLLRRRPGGKIPFVVERPEVAFERLLYLKKMAGYRSHKRSIYYIGEASVSSKGEVLTSEETLVYSKGPETRLFPFFYFVFHNPDHKTAVSCSFSIVEDLNASSFIKWITKDVLATTAILDNSVIVLDNSENHNETICTPLTDINKSLKSEIKEWLEHHLVPYTNDMSKRQLWKLAEKLTDIHENVYVVDNILKQHGHCVLRLPNCINELSLATAVRQLVKCSVMDKIQEEQSLQVTLESIRTAIIFNKLNGYNSSLIKEENKLLDMDIKTEKIRDLLEEPICCSLGENDDKNFDIEFPFFVD
ncbi:uncharacterized protein LOC121736852 [Aricia agestis]|uniref:uncharacterized protein LOC121736852 n=1 Tax=Aricia agestis TaxID=91739 RepID=UPI001C20834A|nr:uncharacterized protein LOC121736852 [Aricia agestis]